MKKILALAVALLLAVTCFAACTPAATTSAAATSAAATKAAATTAAATQAAATTAAATQAAATSASTTTAATTASNTVHEIYKLMPQLSLAGIVDPNQQDRASLDKAWPKTPKDSKKIVIGWSEINQSSDWFVTVKTSAEAEAKKYGYTLDFLVANDDTQKQSEAIDTFITKGVDIIVVDPVNSSAPVEDINRAVKAGIPVLCTGAFPEDCAALTTLCSNTFMNGFETGKYAASKFTADEEINATMLVGVMGSSCTESRLCGAVAGILSARMEAKGKAYSCDEDAWLAGYNMFKEIKSAGKSSNADAGFTVSGYGTGSWTVEGGLAAAEDLCTANANMNLMIAENDFMAAGGIKALKSAGMEKVKVMAVADGTTAGLELIKQGSLLCTGLNSGEEQGKWAIDFINAIFEGGKDPSDLPLGSYFTAGVISSENVDQYYDANSLFYKAKDFTFPQTIPEIKAASGK